MSTNAAKNISIPAIALLRNNVGKVIFCESQMAIIAPGVGAPIKARKSTTNMRVNNEVLTSKLRGVTSVKIKIIVRGSNPVNAPIMAGRQRTGATSICSLGAST